MRHGLISVTPPYDLKGLGPAIDGPESTSQTPQDTNIVDGEDMDTDRPGDPWLEPHRATLHRRRCPGYAGKRMDVHMALVGGVGVMAVSEGGTVLSAEKVRRAHSD